MKHIIIIDDVFTMEEYETIIRNDLTMKPSLFNGKIDTDRNSKQCNYFNENIANLLLLKVKKVLPEVININPCLRYITYDIDGFFKLHYDEQIMLNGILSKYTVIYYINTCDGHTIITDDNFNKHTIDNIKNRLLIFHQDLEHEGYNKDIKHIIRTDAF